MEGECMLTISYYYYCHYDAESIRIILLYAAEP